MKTYNFKSRRKRRSKLPISNFQMMTAAERLRARTIAYKAALAILG